MPQHQMYHSQVLALYFCMCFHWPSLLLWIARRTSFFSIALTGLLLLLCHDNFNIMLKLKQYSLHWIAKITLSSEIILKLWLLSKLPRIVSNPLSILCGIPWTSWWDPLWDPLWDPYDLWWAPCDSWHTCGAHCWWLPLWLAWFLGLLFGMSINRGRGHTFLVFVQSRVMFVSAS